MVCDPDEDVWWMCNSLMSPIWMSDLASARDGLSYN